MATIDKLTVVSSGFQGAPGYTTLYAGEWTGFQPAAVTFFQGLSSLFDQSVSFQIPNGGETIEDTTGELVGDWSDGTNTQVQGSVSGTHVDGVGMRIRWRTSGFTAGRRVTGTTFLVPIVSGSYQMNGGLTGTAISDAQSAADAFITAMTTQLVVFSRPTETRPGSSSSVTSAFVPDAVSWLRTRKS